MKPEISDNQPGAVSARLFQLAGRARWQAAETVAQSRRIAEDLAETEQDIADSLESLAVILDHLALGQPRRTEYLRARSKAARAQAARARQRALSYAGTARHRGHGTSGRGCAGPEH